ncbi:MAG: DUF6492 family protein [Pseudomonadota bacterium]
MNISIITPSYKPDYQRCKLLCKSIDLFVSNYKKHIIIVDRSDYALFKTLENNKTEIICKEDILPSWLIKIPFTTKWWLNLKGLPVRGWILQQIVKLSVHEFVDADIYLFADSDVSFIRPFDLNNVINNNLIRLCSMPRKKADYVDRRKQRWHLSAAKMLGVNDTELLTRDYITQLVFWRRDTLIKLTRYLETKSLETKSIEIKSLETKRNKNWKEYLANTLDFSEYTLYGIFSEHVLAEASGHYREPEELCYCSWHQNIHNATELKHYLSNIPKKFYAVLIQSNLGISTHNYQEQLAHLQNNQSMVKTP